MHLPSLVPLAPLLLLPLTALAHSPPHGQQRRITHRDLPLIARAGVAIDNGTLASISSADAAASSTASQSSLASSTDGARSSSISSAAQSSVDPATSSTPISSAAQSSSTQDQVTPSSVQSSAAPSSVIPSSSSTTSVAAGPSTISVPSSSSTTTAAGIVTRTTSSALSVTTATKTSSSSASATAANDSTSTTSSGLSKPALIAIVVVASVVGLAAIGWTAFRKWKLRPSGRFDKKMKPIDFGPHGVDDDFLEKTLHRSTSNSSVDRQRQQYATELDDPNHVAGIPEHDFTAGPAHGAYAEGAVGETYNQDPYYHAQAYEYEQGYNNHSHAYPPTGAYDHTAYPAQAEDGAAVPHQYGESYGGSYAANEYPNQDQPVQDGYADLHRGNSGGSGGHGHEYGQGGSAHGHAAMSMPQPQVYPDEFPSPDTYLGRPTGGNEGPYAQAAQYRGY
ncbi:hypothetical protein EHS25_010200 [Saitozyma podzolica]|uniref:Mid2 domain-containing protein n=1 Tax=Saitozyma podzolica TaxID=1890683 RepID=A0A427YIV2_9TREE|nr:hypothetical protein EHS25_010200 [Saitozyma podzolica]